MDDNGASQVHAVHEIYKHKLSSLTGEKQGLAVRSDIGNTIQSEKQLEELTKEKMEANRVVKEKIGECGNCYGAGTKGQCCQTCQDVKDAYERIGWRFKPQGITQCASEAFLTNMNEQFAEDGGCQIYGRLELNHQSGNFHIAPHKKLHTGGTPEQQGLFNLMDLISFTFDQFNITHTINSLSFGDNFPGIRSPLDGKTNMVDDTHAMYQYYIKVVPTKYKKLDGQVIESNQYSVTEHKSHLAPGSGRGLPGLYFNYEVSPIQALFEERRARRLLPFIVSVCAIIGGVFSVMRIVDLVVGYLLTFANPTRL